MPFYTVVRTIQHSSSATGPSSFEQVEGVYCTKQIAERALLRAQANEKNNQGHNYNCDVPITHSIYTTYF